ncbi:Uncharacterized protein conserved in bacteria [Chlamydia trachomatis]|nr:Uncharacterized protein conserved in bacteria [Chlamydia trachomatis]
MRRKCAQFIWNRSSGQPGFDPETDVDIIFYDPDVSYEETCQLEKQLLQVYPQYRWELKNQVYMHIHNPGTAPYINSKDAMSKYPETCTAIGVRLMEDETIEVFAPYGLEVIRSFRIELTPHFFQNEERRQLYHTRLQKKNWLEKWPNLQITNIPIED